MNSTIRYLLILLMATVLLSSCNRYVLFSHDGTTDSRVLAVSNDTSDKVLEADDKISISVWGHDDLSIGSVHSTFSVAEDAGKWLMLDANGEVNLPQIGKIKLAGKTTSDAVKVLTTAYSKYITDPIINLRVLNNQVTVIGEVQKPGNYIFSSASIRLTDVLGRTAGFTDYAKTTNVKIIRGKESFVIDMTNAGYSSMHVLPGDVVYVPQTKGKKFDRVVSKIIPFASLLTAIALIYNITNN